VKVDFYYGLESRYSYLASTQAARLEQETGCTLEWLPINSSALYRARGVSPFEGAPVSGQYEWSYRERDAARWAALYSVPFAEPRGRVRFDPQLLALAATAAKRLGAVVPYTHALYAAMFVDSVAEIGPEECIRGAVRCGLSPDTFERELSSPATSAEQSEMLERALSAGVFGVPSFVVDGELFWGNDRLILLRHHLASKRREADYRPTA
jgi:2-hydroxychromene-2-carboxylate isomerase